MPDRLSCLSSHLRLSRPSRMGEQSTRTSTPDEELSFAKSVSSSRDGELWKPFESVSSQSVETSLMSGMASLFKSVEGIFVAVSWFSSSDLPGKADDVCSKEDKCSRKNQVANNMINTDMQIMHTHNIF